MGLCLHAGAELISRSDLASLPLPTKLGARHNPLPFIEDVQLVERSLAQYNLRAKEEAFGVSYAKDGSAQRFFGVLELAGEYDDHGVVVGLRGSYDQSISRGLAVGSRVFVCDNLAFSGEVTYHTKQSTFINERLPRLVAAAVEQVPVLAHNQQQRFNAYRNFVLKPRWGDSALVELLRRDVLNSQSLPRAVAEWDHPSHEEHADDGFSLWRLHNAVTEAIKPTNPERANVLPAWDRTIKLTQFLDEVCGV